MCWVDRHALYTLIKDMNIKSIVRDRAPLSGSRIPNSKKHQYSAPAKYGTVAVVGLGYVGLPLALLCEEHGYSVIGVDADATKIANLNRKQAPFLSPEEQEALTTASMSVHVSPSDIAKADVVIICVPTPVFEDHTPDLRPLESACQAVGIHMKRGALILIESTVNPGVCEDVAIPLLERYSNMRADEDFYVAHCPERINPGDPQYSVRNIARVVGARTDESRDRAVEFYRSVLDAEIMPMGSIKEAEAVKMVENSFRDINIAFVNELAMSFDRLGIDVTNVIKGASTKPFAFMAHYPGCGVGGHCIPVDPYYLIDYAEKNGFTHTFLKNARQINSGMPRYTVEITEKALGRPLTGTTIALLGLAYKRDIPDLRESPALVIREKLEKEGATVQSFDPYTADERTHDSIEEALKGADAVIIATDHREIRALTPDDFLKAGVSVVIDGKNCLPKESFRDRGITYRGIGR